MAATTKSKDTKTGNETNHETTAKTTAGCRIHFADGNKGGVGKSFLARVLYQYFLDYGIPVMGVEADVDSPDFRGIYPEVQVSRFSEDEMAGGQANDILNWALEEQKNIVVNLPATVHKPFVIWLDQYKILEVAQEASIGLVKWFVCTGEYDSMKSLGVSLKTLGDKIPHVVVRNRKYADWAAFETDAETQGLIQEYACPVIDLPKLTLPIASLILRQRLSFQAAQEYQGPGFGMVQQVCVRTYLKQAYAQFEMTGLV
jgi:CobQ/CobB/MinD/ParA nucleotide binding domain